MQKKGSILFLLVAVSILVAGCQLTGSSDKGTIPDSSSAFKGKDGLVLSFFDDAPPDKVIPSSKDFKSKFNIAVLLENKGAADITCDGDSESCGFFLVFSKEPIKITSYLKEGTLLQAVTGNLKDALEEIDGKSKLIGKESYLSGGRAAMEFSAEVEEDVDVTTLSAITVNACYPYKTSLSASACVQTAHYTVPEKSRVCELKTLSFSNQGAPVAITKIEQESILSGEYVKPRFKIYISDVGKGTVIDKDKESLKKACTVNNPEIGEIVGKVTIEEATLSGEKLNCQQGNGITLTGVPKKDFIECILERDDVFKANAANNLVSPLKMVLSYGYQTAISKDVKIEVLDSPPRIKRMAITPEKPKPGDELKIFVSAEDDFGLEELQFLDKDGKLILRYPCGGSLSCSNTFKISGDETKLKPAGEVFIYKAQAVDTSKKPSDISTVSGIFGGISLTVSSKEITSSDGKKSTQITATATSTYTRITSLEMLNSDGTPLSSSYLYTCPSGIPSICTTIFTIEKAGDYKIRAKDSAGPVEASVKIL